MTRFLRLLPAVGRIAARPRVFRATPSLTRTYAGPAGHDNLDTTVKNYPNEDDLARLYELDPGSKADYGIYVQLWRKHFQECEDDFELERGLNHIFATDWVPSIEVIEDALRAARRHNQFATAVRILEALENKADKGEYQGYLNQLKPLLEEYGIPEKKDLGQFKKVLDLPFWMRA
ncbi:Cytochrome c oxidase subunit 6 [Rhizophlyctis rosea]|uniref:Cytochrome c oxidase subunit 6, mitochondrial n=1 Tax=Rhizophlyctis rosea TaxID=64517 RepID=A0AAD5X640_9FUNG|nr:Cytochrome c oxidase subunit 6 [Rhizophlyctis rosea]